MRLAACVRAPQGARAAHLSRLNIPPRPIWCSGHMGRSPAVPKLVPPATSMPTPTIRAISTSQACAGARPDPALDTPLLQRWLEAVGAGDIGALFLLIPEFQRELRAVGLQRGQGRAGRPSGRYPLAIRDGLQCVLDAFEQGKCNGSTAWPALIALHLANLVPPGKPFVRRTLSALIRAATEHGAGSLDLAPAALEFLEKHQDLASNPTWWVELGAALVTRGDLKLAQSVLDKARTHLPVFDGSYDLEGLFPLAVLQDTVHFQLATPTDDLTSLVDELDLNSVPTSSLAQGLRFLTLSKLRSNTGERLHSELSQRADRGNVWLGKVIFHAARCTGDSAEKMETLWSLVPAARREGRIPDDLFTTLFLLSTEDRIRDLRNYDQALALIYRAEHIFGRTAPAAVWEACVDGLVDRQPYAWWRQPTTQLVPSSTPQHRVVALSPLRVIEAGLLLDQRDASDGPLPAGGWTRVLETYASQLVPDQDAILRTWNHILATSTGPLALHGAGGCYEVVLPLVRGREGMKGVLALLQTAAERQDFLSVLQLGSLKEYVALAQNEEELLGFHRALMQLLSRGLLAPEVRKWQDAYLMAVVNRRFPQYNRRGKLQPLGLAVSGDGLLEVCRGLRRIGRAPDGVQFVKILNNVKRASARESDIRRSWAKDEMVAQAARRQAGDQVAALHTAMQEDAEVEPDIRLLNSLMNAYNFVGDAEGALGIWFSILRDRHATTPSTLSILFDLCGWSRFPNTGTRAWNWARERDRAMDEACRHTSKRLVSPRRAPPAGHRVNKAAPRLRPGQVGAPEDSADSREWMQKDTARLVNDHVKLSYIEMLCRCFLLRPACDLAWTLVETGEMEGKAGVEREMWALLLKFLARKRDRVTDSPEQRGLYDALRKRIRTERPHVWDKDLARVGTTSRPTGTILYDEEYNPE